MWHSSLSLSEVTSKTDELFSDWRDWSIELLTVPSIFIRLLDTLPPFQEIIKHIKQVVLLNRLPDRSSPILPRCVFIL